MPVSLSVHANIALVAMLSFSVSAIVGLSILKIVSTSENK
jgi:hypothetical protein